MEINNLIIVIINERQRHSPGTGALTDSDGGREEEDEGAQQHGGQRGPLSAQHC